MAICSSRSESIASPVMLGSWGVRTDLVVWVDAGAGGQESSAAAVGNGTTLIGRSLDAGGVRTNLRAVPMAVNSRKP